MKKCIEKTKKFFKMIVSYIIAFFKYINRYISRLSKTQKRVYVIYAVLLILFIISMIVIYNKIIRKYTLHATNLYNKVHELYFFGGDIEYEIEDNERVFIELDDSRYYKISNYSNSVSDLFTENKLSDVQKYLNIEKNNNEYYMKDIGRGISNYYETTLKLKYFLINKRVFIAKSKFCKIDSQVTYGDGCRGKNEYYINKRFILKKENKVWKIDEYTSIFEMEEESLK